MLVCWYALFIGFVHLSVQYKWILNRIQYNDDPNVNDDDEDHSGDDLWVDPTKRVKDILGVFFGKANGPLRLWFTSKVLWDFPLAGEL